MSGPGPFKLKLGLPQPTSRFGVALKNVAMFLIALAVTAGLGTVLKNCTADAGVNGGYYLEARQSLRTGDVLSPENVVWRPVRGQRLAGAIMSPDRSGASVFGQTLTRPVMIGKPILVNSLTGLSVGAIDLQPGELAFVLSGAETEAVSGFVKVGGQVNVIAVLGAGRSGNYVDPTVGTVVESARVLAVRQPVGRRANGAGVTLAILLSQQEAEDLAAWRFSGRLVVALAGALVDDGDRVVDWRPLYETQAEPEPGLSTSGGDEVAIYVSDEEVQAEPEPQGPIIEIVSPSGIQLRAVQ